MRGLYEDASIPVAARGYRNFGPSALMDTTSSMPSSLTFDRPNRTSNKTNGTHTTKVCGRLASKNDALREEDLVFRVGNGGTKTLSITSLKGLNALLQAEYNKLLKRGDPFLAQLRTKGEGHAHSGDLRDEATIDGNWCLSTFGILDKIACLGIYETMENSNDRRAHSTMTLGVANYGVAEVKNLWNLSGKFELGTRLYLVLRRNPDQGGKTPLETPFSFTPVTERELYKYRSYRDVSGRLRQSFVIHVADLTQYRKSTFSNSLKTVRPDISVILANKM